MGTHATKLVVPASASSFIRLNSMPAKLTYFYLVKSAKTSFKGKRQYQQFTGGLCHTGMKKHAVDPAYFRKVVVGAGIKHTTLQLRVMTQEVNKGLCARSLPGSTHRLAVMLIAMICF